MELMAAIDFIRNLKAENPQADKERVETAFAGRFAARKERKIYVCGGEYSVRFSEVNKRSFSNTVASLSALMKLDHLPFVVCIIRPDRVDFQLANTTLLRADPRSC